MNWIKTTDRNNLNHNNMNIKQLKEKIKDLPDHMDVFIRQQNDEFELSLAYRAEVKDVTFSDEDLTANDTCLVLTDQ